MKDYIVKRVIEVSNYIIETGSTVREAAKVFEISKSTVHKDCTERLYDIDRKLYASVKNVLKLNLSQRHLRGGEATRRKYLLKKKLKIFQKARTEGKRFTALALFAHLGILPAIKFLP